MELGPTINTIGALSARICHHPGKVTLRTGWRNTPMNPVIVERIAKADAVIVESVKDKDWHKKLKAWQHNDDWDVDRFAPAKALERLMTSLNHTDEEALANVNTLIKHDNNLTFPSGYIPGGGRRVPSNGSY